jgi:hypothetical protein
MDALTFSILNASCAGRDPRIHLLCEGMDCRVKPGNDNGGYVLMRPDLAGKADYDPPNQL